VYVNGFVLSTSRPRPTASVSQNHVPPDTTEQGCRIPRHFGLIKRRVTLEKTALIVSCQDQQTSIGIPTGGDQPMPGLLRRSCGGTVGSHWECCGQLDMPVHERSPLCLNMDLWTERHRLDDPLLIPCPATADGLLTDFAYSGGLLPRPSHCSRDYPLHKKPTPASWSGISRFHKRW
jgi:hypothetical protein